MSIYYRRICVLYVHNWVDISNKLIWSSLLSLLSFVISKCSNFSKCLQLSFSHSVYWVCGGKYINVSYCWCLVRMALGCITLYTLRFFRRQVCTFGLFSIDLLSWSINKSPERLIYLWSSVYSTFWYICNWSSSFMTSSIMHHCIIGAWMY